MIRLNHLHFESQWNFVYISMKFFYRNKILWKYIVNTLDKEIWGQEGNMGLRKSKRDVTGVILDV